METKKQNQYNTQDLENFMTMVSLNTNMMEAMKSIKLKNNEAAIKALKALKDKPTAWPELIIASITSQNFKILEFMYENFTLDFGGSLEISPILLSSEILQDSYASKTIFMENKDKELYTNVEAPYMILGAISGDIDIFLFIKNKGANLNLNLSGHFALSKRQRNSVVSNVLGAAAYYGRTELIKFILEKFTVDINCKCVEKKVKKKQFTNLTKEFSDMTPFLLAVVSDAQESFSIEVMKMLQEKNANIHSVDFNKNTFLHLAVKHNKFEIIKHFSDILGEFLYLGNKDGQTPIGIAQENKQTDVFNFLTSLAKNPQNQKNIEEDLNELIEINNLQRQKKKKKNKKGPNDDIKLLNSTNFEETIKFKPAKQTTTQEVVEEVLTFPIKRETEIEGREEIDKKNFQNKNENNNYINEGEKENYQEEYEYYTNPDYKRNHDYDYNNYYQYNNYDYNGKSYYGYGNKAGRHYQNYKGNYQDSNKAYYKNEREYTGRYKSREDKQYFNEKIKTEDNLQVEEHKVNIYTEKVEAMEPQQRKSSNIDKNVTLQNQPEKKPTIIGLDAKTLKKLEKKKDKKKEKIKTAQAKEQQNVEEKDQLEVNEEKVHIRSNVEFDTHNIHKESVNIIAEKKESDVTPKIQDEKINNHDESKSIDEDFLKEENETKSLNNEQKLDEKVEEGEKEIAEGIQKDSGGENQEKIKEFEENRMDNIFINENSLYATEIIKEHYIKKCLSLEEDLEKEKREKEIYYKLMINKNLENTREALKRNQTNNTNDEIEDLLHLANSELDIKSKKINDLTSKLEELELKNVKFFSREKLNELKKFYSDGLGIVIDALNNLK